MLIISPNSKMSAHMRFLIIALAATLLFVTCLVINYHPSSEISDSDSGPHHKKKETSAKATAIKYTTMSQDEAEIFYLENMVRRAEKGSVEMEDAKRKLDDVISHRKHVDQSVRAIVRVIVDGQSIDANATTFSQVLEAMTELDTWDWKCLKAMLANYQAQCGTLRFYGLHYNQLFANLCHFGISPKQLSVAARQICLPHMVNPLWMAEDKDTVVDPVALNCGHIFCYMCACSAASVTIVDGLHTASPKEKCPLCREAGVYDSAVHLDELNILLSHRCREYWEERLHSERAERIKQTKLHWETQCRAFMGV